MEKNNNSKKMEWKQCIYTLLLIITCFIASPMIIGKIWKSSADVKKKAEPKHKVEETTTAPSDIEVVTEEYAESVTEAVTEADTEPETEAVTKEGAEFRTSTYLYFNDALFIGDSRTVGLRDYGSLDNAGYFCDVGLATYNLYDEPHDGYYLDEVLDNGTFGKVYVMLGINELGNDFEYTMNLYRALIEKIRIRQPNAMVYIMGNLHVASYAEHDEVTNENINELNRLMSELADNTRIIYIDSNEIYDDENGAMREDVTGDGLHTFADQYDKWCEWLCRHTVQNPDGGGYMAQ